MRIEVYEKIPDSSGGYSPQWWADNMPVGSTPPISGYTYRRTMPFVDDIERPIEIIGNEEECIIRFWSGEEMTIKDNYDDFCIRLHDVEEQMLMEEEYRYTLMEHEFNKSAE